MKDHIKEYQKKWRQEHPDYQKNWQKAHPGYLKKWRENNPNHLKKWAEENPERMKYLSDLRVKRLNESEGSFTKEEWEAKKKEYFYTCPSCMRSEPEITLQVDHIIPVSKKGSSYIINIQPLCGSCNSIKKNNIRKFKPKKNGRPEEIPIDTNNQSLSTDNKNSN